jgi:hypothetical protein
VDFSDDPLDPVDPPVLKPHPHPERGRYGPPIYRSYPREDQRWNR